MSNEISVQIGKVKIGRNENVLHAILGSCVGIAFLWREEEVYGLAHCLLSECPDKRLTLGGRYVDQAIFSLQKMMRIKDDDLKQIRAIVAGGGNMTRCETTSPEKLVGYNNARYAIKCLKEKKIKVIHEDTGGLEGRKITVYCKEGDFDVKPIPRL